MQTLHRAQCPQGSEESDLLSTLKRKRIIQMGGGGMG